MPLAPLPSSIHFHPLRPLALPAAADLLLSLPPSRAPHAVVLEVGIGGRLDATNALCPRPAAAGITSLGFDHMELLGHTLPVRVEPQRTVLVTTYCMCMPYLHSPKCDHAELLGHTLPVHVHWRDRTRVIPCH